MSSVPVKTIYGRGKIFKAGDFLCNVTFSYRKSGNPDEVPVRIVGVLQVEESKRMSLEILNGLMGVPLELLTDSGDTMDIFASRLLSSVQDGRYRFVPISGGTFPIK